MVGRVLSRVCLVLCSVAIRWFAVYFMVVSGDACMEGS